MESKKVVLTVADRVILIGLLPAENDYLTYRVIKDLKEQISFSEGELIDLNIVQKDKMVTWDKKMEVEKEINLGNKGEEIIKEVLVKLSTEKKINDQNISLYEKFIKE